MYCVPVTVQKHGMLLKEYFLKVDYAAVLSEEVGLYTKINSV